MVINKKRKSGKIKVLMVGPSFKQDIKGGIAVVAEMLYNSLLSNEYRIHYVATTILVGNKFKKFIFFIKSFFMFISSILIKGTKIIHVHTASRSSFYRKSFLVLVSKILGKIVILNIHGGEFHIFYNEHGNFQAKFIRRVLDSVDKIIVLTKHWQDNVKKMTSNDNISILYNPVDCITNCIYRDDEFKSREKKILYIGELSEKKGVYTLIQAIPTILEKNKKVKFILAGNGEIAKVNRLCIDANIEEYTFVPGFVTGAVKNKYLAEADIYVLPSYNEGLPVSILEAMGAGLPIITTYVGGIPEAVKNDVNGFLVKPGNSEMLADRILRLLDDDKLRKKMGKESKRIANKKFDVNIITEELLEIYKEVLAKTRI